MQNKDDKVGKLLINKKGKIEIDSQIKSKKPFNYFRLVGKYAFFDAKTIFSHSFSHAN